jgi:hypothetical protein
MGVGLLAETVALRYITSSGPSLVGRLLVIIVATIVGLVPAAATVMLAFTTVRRRSRTAYMWLSGLTIAVLLFSANDSAARLAGPNLHLGGRGARETEWLGLLIGGGAALFLIGLFSAMAFLALPSTRRSLTPR